ncbi:adenylosuccinate synthase [Butyricicoccus faecihominis]|uniref:adenylosuccinate synthase n=1 Tax=Butyricicoccaceae TaxID=3085642 RepID=UPI00247857BC|nr:MULTISPECIES: adenylosuccinate synthase [Butyricicoccaceae]MCQ5129269.1 adenylosuccinate synthase [Butyricicoccus faecihominis]WNX84984.1 adenylosuccinate synthase [Agathobaculum sp. NTUH-O15-33]
MPGKVILGAQWGDEGKGKFIDIFAAQADLVVRSQGGNNAGHTVVVEGETYKLQLIPSGILYPNCVNVIGPGVVVDPRAILKEIDGLAEKGVSTDRLYIDARCHCILPWHLELDALSEKARGGDDIGTTKKGIGPTYMDKAERIGVRMHDFTGERFEEAMREACARKNKVITGVYGGEPLDIEAVLSEYKEYADRLRAHVRDTSVLTYEAVKAGKQVLFEGAQGTLLDLDMGTYPYVTSSHPVAGGCCIGSGVGPTAISDIMGICKSYTTRVGKGPFPTELFDETGDYIRKAGGEFGTVTGRPRRTGWFDAVIARYAVRVNGLTELVINKIDPLRGLPKLKVCVAYDYKGQRLTEFPANFADLEHCKPIYEEFDGFDEDITACRSFSELPQSVQSYIRELERIVDCPISMLGVGPARDQVMTIK